MLVSVCSRASADNGKKTENSTFKPLSTVFVPCLKIQGPPRCRRPWVCHTEISQNCTKKIKKY